METFIKPARNEWGRLCQRPSAPDPIVLERVEEIIARVERDGDKALFELAYEIDGVCLENLRVSDEEMAEASKLVDGSLKAAIKRAAENILAFHDAQYPSQIEVDTTLGVKCIQRPVPIAKVGLYVPGGTAPLFSTVLMLGIPASVAGCQEIVLCTPCRRDSKVDPAVLYAASLCGVTQVFKVGGAQAVAAMAFGTESIPRVDKIFGPGNRYVTMAKQLLGGRMVAVDMPAGPSEVMVLADSSAKASYVAADLLSQAEHGSDSQVMLVCESSEFASDVKEEVARQASKLGRGELVARSLAKSRIIVLSGRDEMIEFAEQYAPEHLIVSMSEPWEIVDEITCAGSVFVGNYSPESAGDYASGTNHTLPTCGWARSCSGVNVDSFMRKMTIQEISREGLERLSETIVTMAEAEGLGAHANAIKVRLSRN